MNSISHWVDTRTKAVQQLHEQPGEQNGVYLSNLLCNAKPGEERFIH